MVSNDYKTEDELGPMFGLTKDQVKQILNHYGFIRNDGNPSRKAIEYGFVRRQRSSKRDAYQWLWHAGNTVVFFDCVGFRRIA